MRTEDEEYSLIYRLAGKWPSVAVLLLFLGASGCATLSETDGAGPRSMQWAPRQGDWALGVPIYPGADLFEMVMEKGRVIYLALITIDHPEKVEDFYSGSLRKISGEWKTDQLLDGRHFWRGGPWPDPYGSFGAPTMDIRVSPLRFKSHNAPSAQTIITIQDRELVKDLR
ncbi:MAG: hypothetical protein OEZ55_09995 [Nitrospinota bacterium]|nr:hypothetical protein [Nitrospinota bacterium]